MIEKNASHPLYVLDKLVILSIYFSILPNNPALYSKPFFLVSMFLFILILIGTPGKKRFQYYEVNYFIIVCISFLILLSVGLVKGNSFINAMVFFIPIFYLLYIFVYKELSESYSLDRYLKHYFFASIFLAFKLIFIYWLFRVGCCMQYLPFVDTSVAQGTWLSVTNGVVRVFSGQAIVFPIGFLLAFYFRVSKVKLFLILAIFAYASLLTQTVAVIFALFVAALFVMNQTFSIKRQFIYLSVSIFISVIVIYAFQAQIMQVIAEKMKYSVSIKLSQFGIALKSLFDDFLFGGGMGYKFGNGANVLEVVPLHVLGSTGVVGFMIYTYMYFYWILKVQVFMKDRLMQVLVFSFLLIVVMSFSNPYLLGGSSGLFLLPIIAAGYMSLKKSA